PATEDDDVDQRVRAQPVRSVHRHACAFADCVETRQRRVLLVHDYLAVDVGRNAPHCVVRRRLHRYHLGDGVDTEVGAHKVGDVGQLRLNQFAAQMPQIEIDVILSVDAAAFGYLLIDGPRDHIPGCKVEQGRRVALHEPLAFAVDQNASLAAGTPGDEYAHTVDARRMELEKLHVH